MGAWWQKENSMGWICCNRYWRGRNKGRRRVIIPMKYILTDTGFWRALLDSEDDYKRQSVAKEAFSYIEEAKIKILIPSNAVYSELFNTTFLKKGNKIEKIDHFEKLLRSEIIVSINDGKYRDEALATTLNEGKRCQKISFVDNIIRLIARDLKNEIIYLITFDKILMTECAKYVDIYEKCYQFG
ncbi:MAG: hypothetical protein WA102_04240 [Candidatus Methanoperedens sp.]